MKPYRELADSDDRPIEEVADEVIMIIMTG